MPRDLIVLAGMVVAVSGGVWGCVHASLFFVRIGALLCALMICLGLAYFGWSPLFGGSHDPGAYFGGTMLLVGLLGAAILGAVEESYRRVVKGPDEPRGFPVMTAESKDAGVRNPRE